ncbi:MAG: S4 domain-containing protein, partial [Dehalococcoidia bacterium]|nr:S4 domain-containing protein [Dehalococcoidia bacterium]
KDVERGGAKAMDAKARLAREVVSQFHDAAAARQAEAGFERTFRKRELPRDVPERALSFRELLTSSPHFEEDGERYAKLPWLLAHLELAPSQSEAQRLIRQKAVEVDGEAVASPKLALRDGMVIRVGKHRFLRIVDADKHPQSS